MVRQPKRPQVSRKVSTSALLAGTVPACASVAALLYVARVMTRSLAEIDWEDVTEYAPPVVTQSQCR
jgi:xanthine/uracil/vitamin C permease (AzgA family)